MSTYDLLTAAGEPIGFPLAGETLPVRPLKLKEWAKLQAWIVNRYPGPVARAAMAIQEAAAAGRPLSPEAEDTLLDHADRKQMAWPPRVGSPAWRDALDADPEGLTQFLWVVLAAADPTVPRDRAAQLAERATAAEVVAVYEYAVYGVRVPKEPAAAAASPPGPAPAAVTPNPTSGARSPSSSSSPVA